MGVSKFTIYSSNDPYGPGLLMPTIGSLITLLDTCLVNGYIGKAAAGWTKPLTNEQGGYGVDVVGCYKQGAGLGHVLYVNDSGPGASTGQEARAVGWVGISSLNPQSLTTFGTTNSVGSGYGQFPLPAQLLTYGHVVISKSSSATVGRDWILFADSRTLYLFINLTGSGDYTCFTFGDYYSYYGAEDNGRTCIHGRLSEGSPASFLIAIDTSGYMIVYPNIFTGFYLSGTPMGGGSVQASKTGINFGASVNATSSLGWDGSLSFQNGQNNSLYMAPLLIYSSNSFRGKARGIYHGLVSTNNFTNGQIIQGGGDFFDKKFMVIKGLSKSSSYFFIEVSETVQYN